MDFVLDHVSVESPSHEPMVRLFFDKLGLITTMTPEARGRHGRVYLDRSYLEVAEGTGSGLPFFFPEIRAT